MVDHSAKLGVHVIVLPEYVASPHWFLDQPTAAALADQCDEVVKRFGEISAKYGCYVVVSHVEAVDGDLCPTAFLIGPTGEVAGHYRKVHLTAEEKVWAVAGASFPVFETERGRIGVMLGYDGLFPEAARCLALEGADLIVWPTTLREPHERDWIAVPRAADNRCALVLANRTDSPYPGGSVVIPATGFPVWEINQVAPPNRRMGVVLPAFIDLAVCRQKQMIPRVDMFANRMPAFYTPIVRPHAT
jgi:predicted amidohydrolase